MKLRRWQHAEFYPSERRMEKVNRWFFTYRGAVRSADRRYQKAGGHRSSTITIAVRRQT